MGRAVAFPRLVSGHVVLGGGGGAWGGAQAGGEGRGPGGWGETPASRASRGECPASFLDSGWHFPVGCDAF